MTTRARLRQSWVTESLLSRKRTFGADGSQEVIPRKKMRVAVPESSDSEEFEMDRSLINEHSYRISEKKIICCELSIVLLKKKNDNS